MAKNTIKLRNRLSIHDEFLVASGKTLTPGQFVDLTSAGTITPTIATSQNTGMVVVEDELQGKGITDTYAEGDVCQVWTASKGDIVYALASKSEVIAVGDVLALGATGYLEKKDSAATVAVGVALEAATIGSSAAGRVKVQLY